MDYQTHEHDVLVIGAGGAGLRAAIEASAAGVSVGLVCKSLLGKAHTVMAEGGIAAALANVDDRDSWKVHFADTMRGGQYLNNWRMAELHAKEAPDRVRELEAWGAVFDRTQDGRILQRNFGGHRYPRLAHVGDRTGLEMIRTLQDHGIHQGIDVHMECTVVTPAQGRRPRRRRVRLRARARTVHAVPAQGGRARDRRHRPRVQDHEQQLGVHRRRPRAGVRRRRRADGHGVRAVPSDRHGLAAERARHSRHRRRARRRRRAEEQRGPPLHVRRHPGELPSADRRQRRRRLALHAGRQERAPAAGAAHARSRRRCIVREVKEGRGSPHGGVFLDISWIKERLPNAAEHIKKKLPSMYHQFKQLADIDITKEPMEVGPTTHYIMGGVRVDADTQMSTVPGLFAAGECAAGINGANRLGGNSLSDLLVFGKRAGEFAAKFAKAAGAGPIDARAGRTRPRAGPLEPFDRGSGGEGPYQVQYDLQDMMQDLVGIVRTESEMQRALEGLAKLRERAQPRRRRRKPRVQPGLAHGARSAQSADRVGSDHALGDRAQGKPRRPLPRGLSGQGCRFGKFNIVVRKGATARWKSSREPIPEMPAELKAVIEEMK